MFTEAPQWVGRAKGKVKIAVSKKSEVKKNRIRRRRRRKRREAFYNHLESTEGEGIYLEAGGEMHELHAGILLIRLGSNGLYSRLWFDLLLQPRG